MHVADFINANFSFKEVKQSTQVQEDQNSSPFQIYNIIADWRVTQVAHTCSACYYTHSAPYPLTYNDELT
jgi:hypothetical protein